jgi:hypothetical protein
MNLDAEETGRSERTADWITRKREGEIERGKKLTTVRFDRRSTGRNDGVVYSRRATSRRTRMERRLDILTPLPFSPTKGCADDDDDDDDNPGATTSPSE